MPRLRREIHRLDRHTHSRTDRYREDANLFNYVPNSFFIQPWCVDMEPRLRHTWSKKHPAIPKTCLPCTLRYSSKWPRLECGATILHAIKSFEWRQARYLVRRTSFPNMSGTNSCTESTPSGSSVASFTLFIQRDPAAISPEDSWLLPGTLPKRLWEKRGL